MMRVALRLPYRVLEGAARAIFQFHGLDPEQARTYIPQPPEPLDFPLDLSKHLQK
jgi:hypothetical protein